MVIIQPDGLIHTSPGHRPGLVVTSCEQAESLHHTWLVSPVAYEADLQPAMLFFTTYPRAATDGVGLAPGLYE